MLNNNSPKNLYWELDHRNHRFHRRELLSKVTSGRAARLLNIGHLGCLWLPSLQISLGLRVGQDRIFKRIDSGLRLKFYILASCIQHEVQDEEVVFASICFSFKRVWDKLKIAPRWEYVQSSLALLCHSNSWRKLSYFCWWANRTLVFSSSYLQHIGVFFLLFLMLYHKTVILFQVLPSEG